MGMRGLQRERENCKESREEWSREREDCKGNGRTAKRVERNGEWSREGLAKKAEAGRYGGSARMGTRGMAPAWYLQATFVALCVLCPHDLAKKSD